MKPIADGENKGLTASILNTGRSPTDREIIPTLAVVTAVLLGFVAGACATSLFFMGNHVTKITISTVRTPGSVDQYKFRIYEAFLRRRDISTKTLPVIADMLSERGEDCTFELYSDPLIPKLAKILPPRSYNVDLSGDIDSTTGPLTILLHR